jgi:hypothetical protein
MMMNFQFLLLLLLIDYLPHLPNNTNNYIFKAKSAFFKILRSHFHHPYYVHLRHHHLLLRRRRRLDYFFYDFLQIKYQKIQLARNKNNRT